MTETVIGGARVRTMRTDGEAFDVKVRHFVAGPSGTSRGRIAEMPDGRLYVFGGAFARSDYLGTTKSMRLAVRMIRDAVIRSAAQW